jgi:sec-independent protein translocase protein TatB
MAGQVSWVFMVTPPTIQAANLGMADSLILMVLALVVFGPRRLPEIGRKIGKLMYEFRKASNDFKFQMEEELRKAEDADRRKKEEERLRTLALTTPAPTPETIEESQVAEAVPSGEPKADSEASGEAAAASVESPYPGEALYPVQPSVEVGAPSEESYPRIQPPSTGEPVPSLRRTCLAEQVKAAEDSDGPASPEPTAAPAAVPEAEPTSPTSPVTESKAQNA